MGRKLQAFTAKQNAKKDQLHGEQMEELKHTVKDVMTQMEVVNMFRRQNRRGSCASDAAVTCTRARNDQNNDKDTQYKKCVEERKRFSKDQRQKAIEQKKKRTRAKQRVILQSDSDTDLTTTDWTDTDLSSAELSRSHSTQTRIVDPDQPLPESELPKDSAEPVSKLPISPVIHVKDTRRRLVKRSIAERLREAEDAFYR